MRGPPGWPPRPSRFDSEILEIIRNLDAAIGAFEKRERRLLADERRLLAMLRTARRELAARVGRGP